MADEKISGMAVATLSGTEMVEVVQGGVNKRTSTQAIADLGGGVTSVTGTTNRITSSGGATPVLDIDAAYDAAITAQIAAAQVGLWDDRGTFSAAGGAYPTSANGGSGTAGAILKGDIWTISTGGTLPTGQVVEIGDTVRALIDTPGNTQVNWAILQNNIGFTPENAANKVSTITASATEYPNNNGVIAYTTGIQDLFIPASAMISRITNGAAITQIEMATSVLNLLALAFDQTTQEFAQFQIILPRKYTNGAITCTPVWTAVAGAGTVQWGISFASYRNDDPLTGAFGTPQTSDDTLIVANDFHESPTTSGITPSGTLQDRNYISAQISRNPAADTLTADALLLGVWFHIPTDSAKDA
jgi:hypothetical protein